VLEAAERVAHRAHAPYSKFRVGAAIETADGCIVEGCNVENASYGLTICAERAAVFRAVASGYHAFVRVAIWTPTERPSRPCGACRQVLAEFARRAELEVLLGCQGDLVDILTLAELLPEPFGFEDQA